MGRRIPNSTTQKKKALQIKRAIKDGRAEATPADNKQRPPKISRSVLEDRSVLTDRRKASALESRFLRLPTQVLDHFNQVEAIREFQRPFSDELCTLGPEDLQPKGRPTLTCPKRPRWRYGSSAKTVQKNEEAVFSSWLAETDAILSDHTDREPTYFERNLEVWRQLWRVTEVSDILCVLLDVRCPLLHFPPSLATYIQTGVRPRKPVIYVLTKCDMVTEEVVEDWSRYLSHALGNEDGPATIVCVNNYISVERAINEQGTTRKYLPGHNADQRKSLIQAIQTTHTRLCTPPPRVAENPEKLNKWRPRVKSNIDWSALDRPAPSKTSKPIPIDQSAIFEGKAEARKSRKLARQADLALKASNQTASTPASVSESEAEESESLEKEEIEEEHTRVPTQLHIGLIGAPNVGKSSLLNALLNRKVVRASKTPGKTKHLQTIYWTDDIILVDCPGLVSPSYAGMRFQVLASMIPIQSSAFVIDFAAQRLPLEKILGFDTAIDQKFTPDSLLVDFAIRNGFLTAKAARPDTSRAGASILRQLHGSTAWAFKPPTSIRAESPTNGIWLGIDLEEKQPPEDIDTANEEISDKGENSSEVSEEELSENSDSGDDEQLSAAPVNKFAALDVSASEDES